MKDCQVEKVKRGSSGKIKCNNCGETIKYNNLLISKIINCKCNKVRIYIITID